MAVGMNEMGTLFFVAGFGVSLLAVTPNFAMLVIACIIMVFGLWMMQHKWGE